MTSEARTGVSPRHRDNETSPSGPLHCNVGALTGQRPLYRKGISEFTAASAYIDIMRNGHIVFGAGGSEPMAVTFGIVRRIKIPNARSAMYYKNLYNGFASQFASVVEGMGQQWDGRNFMGTLSPEAASALKTIRDHVEEDCSEQ